MSTERTIQETRRETRTRLAGLEDVRDRIGEEPRPGAVYPILKIGKNRYDLSAVPQSGSFIHIKETDALSDAEVIHMAEAVSRLGSENLQIVVQGDWN